MYSEKLFENIYRIGVPLKGNPLKELNSYFIKGRDFDLLIDTGFRTPECQEALEKGLSEIGSDPRRRHVALTHFHSDHSGMADIFVGEDNPIYMSRTDADWMITRYQHPESADLRTNKEYYRRGFTWEMLDYLQNNSPARIHTLKNVDRLNFHKLDDGDLLDMGDRRLECILVPGHTPGNMMLWDEENKIMFTGDHVLFDITPNITSWEVLPNTLGAYLQSLQKAQAFEVQYALPGHRKTGDYQSRIKEILNHHEDRIQNALEIVQENPDSTAMEIAGKMQWKIRSRNWEEFPMVQKHFAVGEAQSHLDYLLAEGKIVRFLDGDVWRYHVAENKKDLFE